MVEPAKTKDDLVKIVNVSGEGETFDKEGKKVPNKHQDIHFSYDGNEYVIKTHLRVRRYLAEHALKKGWSFQQGRNLLQLVELPYTERSAELYPEANDALKEELKKLQAEIIKKDATIENLEEENASLKKKLKK